MARGAHTLHRACRGRLWTYEAIRVVREASRHEPIRLLVLTQYYYPEVGAPQTRLRATVAGLRRRGFQVTVVAPIPSYPLGIVPRGYVWWRPVRERIDGTAVARLPTLAIPGAGMARRMAGHGAFALASLASLAIAGGFHVALIESPPLLLAVTARVLRANGIPYVFHVADPWPDFPIAMGYLRSPVERRIAYGIENLAYRGAAAITTVSPGLVDLLSRKASAAGRVELLPNGVDLESFDHEETPAAARLRLGWEDQFTVVYVGTIGLAQGIGTLLDAARLLDRDVRVRIVGEGIEKAALKTRARAMGLDNVVFLPSVPRHEVPSILAAADAGLVLLRKGPLYEGSLPTKLLETMAAARPVIVGADGYAAEIVRDAEAGYVARAEDAADLARAIDACRHDQCRGRLAAAGLQYVAERFERGAILDRLAEIICSASRTV